MLAIDKSRRYLLLRFVLRGGGYYDFYMSGDTGKRLAAMILETIERYIEPSEREYVG